MLYRLLVPLSDQFAAFNVFRYLTFRAAAAVITAALLALLIGPAFIRRLRRLQIGQSIRQEGPERHQEKAGTPTMGGLLILLAVVVSTLLWADLENPLVWLALGVTLAFGAIGFVDDFLKIKRRQNRGLSGRVKLLLTALVGGAAGWAVLSLPAAYGLSSTVALPFFKRAVFDIGLLYIVLVILVLAATSHSVNLTDGLDGLASGATLIAAATYTILLSRPSRS